MSSKLLGEELICLKSRLARCYLLGICINCLHLPGGLAVSPSVSKLSKALFWFSLVLWSCDSVVQMLRWFRNSRVYIYS